MSVSITSQGGSSLTVNSTVVVADAMITASGATVATPQNQAFTGEIATFADANPYATAGQFTATINWGDGVTSTGTISIDPEVSGEFDVSGTHTYTVPGTFPVFVTISDAGGQSTTAQGTASVTSANSAETIVAAGAAGLFNTSVSGSGDTNTASFDLGFVSLVVMNPTVNTNNASPTPNTDVLTANVNPAVPTSVSDLDPTIIPLSGTDWTLPASVGYTFVRTVTGTSTSGTFIENLNLTISYHYHQADSYTYRGSTHSLSYDQTETCRDRRDRLGQLLGLGRRHHRHREIQFFADGHRRRFSRAVEQHSRANNVGASTSFLSENENANDSYAESGTFSTGSTGTAVAGGSTYGSQATTHYNTSASATTSAGATTIFTQASDIGTVTLTYSEIDTFQNKNGSLTDGGTYNLTETGLDQPSFNGNAMSSSGTINVITGQTTNVSLGINGSIGQAGGTAMSSGIFHLTGGGTGTTTVIASVASSGLGITDVNNLNSHSTQIANMVFQGSETNVGGTTSLFGTLNENDSNTGSGTLTVMGSFVEGYDTGTFYETTNGGSTVQDSEQGQIVTLGNVTTASGTDTTNTSGNSGTYATTSGTASGGGYSGHFYASSGGTGASIENDTSSFLATNTGYSANGNSYGHSTRSSSGMSRQGGTSSTTTTANGVTAQNIGASSVTQQGGSVVTTIVSGGGTLTGAGYSTNAQAPLSRSFFSAFRKYAGGRNVVVPTPALLPRLGFLRSTFHLGISRDFHTVRQLRHFLREGFQAHGSEGFPTLIWNRYVHTDIGRRNVAHHLVVRQLLLDFARSFCCSQRRLHHGVHIVGQYGYCEGEQCRAWIAQGFDLATEHIRQGLECPLYRPASPVCQRHLRRRRQLGRQVGHYVDFRFAALGRLVQAKRDPSHGEGFAAKVQLHALFVDHPRGDATDTATLAAEVVCQRRSVLPDDEERLARRQPEQKLARAEVAVGNDHHRRPNPHQQLRQQRPLLRMTIFARNKFNEQLSLRIQESQGLAWQRPFAGNAELRHTVLGRGQVIAVEIKDLQPRQNFFLGRGHRVDDLGRVGGGLPDQNRTGLWLNVVEFLVDRGCRNTQLVFHRLIGGMDGGTRTRGYRRHYRNDLREEKLLGILSLPGFLEDLIQTFRLEQSLQARSDHNGRRAPFHEPIENRCRQHPCRPH